MATPWNEEGERALQIVPVGSSSPCPLPFRLPSGWLVEERPRSLEPGCRFDRYFYEPVTRRQFRSLKAVMRHLSAFRGEQVAQKTSKLQHQNSIAGAQTTSSREKRKQNMKGQLKMKRKRTMKRKTSRPGELLHKEEMQVIVHSNNKSPFKLPDEWIIVERPRNNIKYAGVIDKIYYEPGTGRQFRSLLSVKKYLAGAEGSMVSSEVMDTINQQAKRSVCGKGFIKAGKHGTEVKGNVTTSQALKQQNRSRSSNLAYLKKRASNNKGETSMCDSASPPVTANWVLGSHEADVSPPATSNWVLGRHAADVSSPSVGDSLLAASLKQKWSESFLSVVYPTF